MTCACCSSFVDADAGEALARVAAAIDSTPGDAVVQLRVTGAVPGTLTAAALREMAGARNVALAMTDLRRDSVPFGAISQEAPESDL